MLKFVVIEKVVTEEYDRMIDVVNGVSIADAVINFHKMLFAETVNVSFEKVGDVVVVEVKNGDEIETFEFYELK
jgi:hypothetical protein